MLMVIKRGDIFYADLRPVVGSEQGGIRPVIVLQNDAGNKYSPTIICAAITSKMNKAKLPTHVPIDCHRCELEKDSVILLEQIRSKLKIFGGDNFNASSDPEAQTVAPSSINA